MHFVRGVSIKALHAAHGAGAQHDPPARCGGRAAEYSRARRRPSKLDPFRDEIHRLLAEDPRLPAGPGA